MKTGRKSWGGYLSTQRLVFAELRGGDDIGQGGRQTPGLVEAQGLGGLGQGGQLLPILDLDVGGHDSEGVHLGCLPNDNLHMTVSQVRRGTCFCQIVAEGNSRQSSF